jgi:sigma-B regulation protein RsbU (phosphoserine phosphatase)
MALRTQKIGGRSLAGEGAGEVPAVIVTDVQGRIVGWNHGAERLYGWSREDALDRSALELLVPTELSETASEIMADLAMASSRGWQGRFQVRRKDGSAIEVYAQNTPIVIDGKVVAILGESTPVDRLRSLDADMAAITPGNGVGAIIDARLKWFESFRAAARSTMSIRDLDHLLQDVLSTVANSLNADAASLLVTDGRGKVLIARSAYGWDAEMTRRIRIAAGAGVSGKILATQEAMVVDELDDVEVFSPELRRSGFHSYVGVPLVERDRAVGVLHATSFKPAHFSAADVKTLSTLAGPVAAAVHRVRQFVELADLANPTQVPKVPGLEMYVRYLAADGGNGGGDWYDTVSREDGTVAIVIGDAAGHGIEALISASSVRHALIAYLHEGHSPAEALSRLRSLVTAASFGTRADFLTVQACVYEPLSKTLHTASAGHPPLLLVRRGTGTYGPLAGPPISSALPYGLDSQHALTLQPGDLVVMYTDGVIEARGEPIDHGLNRLRAAAVERQHWVLSDVCDAIFAATGSKPGSDDRSIILIRAT